MPPSESTRGFGTLPTKMLPAGKTPRLSSIVLIVSNVIPLLGVMFLEWDMLGVIGLYWLENVVVGGVNVLKMAFNNPDPAKVAESQRSPASQIGMGWIDDANREAMGELPQQASGPSHEGRHDAGQGEAFNLDEQGVRGVQPQGGKLFLIPFFIVHYGIFCLVHGVFVFTMFGGDRNAPSIGFSGGPLSGASGLSDQLLDNGLIFAVIGLVVSHLVSFAVNYLGRGEYQRVTLGQLMTMPYGRVVVLHLAILGGGFAVMMLNAPTIALLILIAGKTGIDLAFHLRERKNAQGLAGQEQPLNS